MVGLQDIAAERIVGVQDQGGSRLRRVEDAASHGGDGQAATGGNLFIVQPGDRLQQRAFAYAGATADTDVEGVAHEAALEHAQAGQRRGDSFLHGAEVQAREVEAGFLCRFVMLAQLAYGAFQCLQLVLQVVPAGDFFFNRRQLLAASLQDIVDFGVNTFGGVVHGLT